MTKKKDRPTEGGIVPPRTNPPPVASEREVERTKGAKAGGATATETSSRQVRSGRMHADNDDLTPDQRHEIETPPKPVHGKSRTRDKPTHYAP